MRRRPLLCAALGAALATATRPAPAAATPGLREQVHPLTVEVTGLDGRPVTRTIAVTVYQPDDDARHPLLVFNHGRAPADRLDRPWRQAPASLAGWLVAQGFAVVVPTRAGYGATAGDIDPEASGPCHARDVAPMIDVAVRQVLAAVDLARTLPGIDASRWVVMGQSVGGQAAVATVAADPPGLVGGINLSGGSGGNPHRDPGHPCDPEVVARAFARLAPGARAPMLWVYWANDRYWGTEAPPRWWRAWTEAGGRAELRTLPPAGHDGHRGIDQDRAHWMPLAARFLRGLGFDTVREDLPVPSGVQP